MKKYLIFLLLLVSNYAFSCCMAYQYRLFPVGESNNKLILIEYSLSRYCMGGDGMEETNEVWWLGEVKLVSYCDDSLQVIQLVDSINFKECQCGIMGVFEEGDYFEKSEYYNKMIFYYDKAFALAKKLPNFTIAKAEKIFFNISKDFKISETDNSRIFLTGNIKIETKIEDFFSCFPCFLSEKRLYSTINYNIEILKISCNKSISKKNIRKSKSKFKNIETAFWAEETAWHSISRDYIFVTKE